MLNEETPKRASDNFCDNIVEHFFYAEPGKKVYIDIPPRFKRGRHIKGLATIIATIVGDISFSIFLRLGKMTIVLSPYDIDQMEKVEKPADIDWYCEVFGKDGYTIMRGTKMECPLICDGWLIFDVKTLFTPIKVSRKDVTLDSVFELEYESKKDTRYMALSYDINGIKRVECSGLSIFSVKNTYNGCYTISPAKYVNFGKGEIEEINNRISTSNEYIFATWEDAEKKRHEFRLKAVRYINFRYNDFRYSDFLGKCEWCVKFVLIWLKNLVVKS